MQPQTIFNVRTFYVIERQRNTMPQFYFLIITEPLKNVSSVVVLERKNIAPMKTGALICYEATIVLSEGTGSQFFLPAFRPDQKYIHC